MMNITPKGLFLILVTAFAAAFILSVAVFSARNQEPKTPGAKEWLTVAPEVLSKVKDLEIINLRINRADSGTPGVAFEIKNNSNRAVMAYEVACGKSGISQDGLEEEGKPIVIIQPHGLYTVEWDDDLTPGKPIVLTAAIFDNGDEEGDKSVLKRMRSIRIRERARKNALKEQTSDRSPNR